VTAFLYNYLWSKTRINNKTKENDIYEEEKKHDYLEDYKLFSTFFIDNIINIREFI
jgi:hypothetical protein